MDMGNRAREDRAYKAGVRQAWAGGDYHRFATDLVWHLGAELVAACGIRPSDRVLDVATGSGNVALRAAEGRGGPWWRQILLPRTSPRAARWPNEPGWRSTGSRPTPKTCPSPTPGSTSLPSSVGAMWAPDSQRVADELLRVCRPGGTIGLINFAADGLLAGFLGVFARYSPPPPPWASSPLLWGDPDYLRQPVRRPGQHTGDHPGDLHRAGARRPAWILPVLQGDLRASGRDLRRAHTRPGGRPRPRLSSPSPRRTTRVPRAGQQNWTTSTSGSSHTQRATKGRQTYLAPPRLSQTGGGRI